MAEDIGKLRLEVASLKRKYKKGEKGELPGEVLGLVHRMMQTLESYDAGEVPSGEVCLRILRGDFDYNLEVIAHYTERRLAHPDRRRPKKSKEESRDD